jgi:predicted DNA repair protein MutK
MLLALSSGATVAIAIGPALVTGIAAYFAADRVGVHQREQERRTLRQEAYSRLVASIMAEIRAWHSGSEALAELWAEGHTHLTAVYLIGTETVVEAAKAWTKLSEEVDTRIAEQAEAAGAGLTKQKLVELSRRTYEQYETRLDEARDKLIDAMRRDVGPDGER